jgi:hypothetical protein
MSVNVDGLECADRVAFGFDGPPSGYRVSYQRGSTAKLEDGSGNRVEIDGSAFLVVRLTPAETVQPSPRRLPRGEAKHVHEVVKTGDFEAAVTWVIGLDDERPFTVSTSTTQLSIDIG